MPDPRTGRYSVAELATLHPEDVLELALQLRVRVCNGGTQGEAAEEARQEVLRRLRAAPPAAVAPAERESGMDADEIERGGDMVGVIHKARYAVRLLRRGRPTVLDAEFAALVEELADALESRPRPIISVPDQPCLDGDERGALARVLRAHWRWEVSECDNRFLLCECGEWLRRSGDDVGTWAAHVAAAPEPPR